jgi:hypothetical protein
MANRTFPMVVLVFFSPPLISPVNSEIDDFHIRFSIPAPTGSVETYIYSVDGSLMIEKDIERICISGNQTTYSITRIPAKSIRDVYVGHFGTEFAVFVDIHRSGIDEKSSVLIDCSGQEWPQDAGLSSIILTGSDEALAISISNRIREEF